MRTDASAYSTVDIERDVLVELWKGYSSGEILTGQGSGQLDLSPYTNRVNMTHNKVTVGCRYFQELQDCSVRPKPGDIITIKTDGTYRFVGVVTNIDSIIEERGTRGFTVTARTRDGVGGWRRKHATSQVYPQGTAYYALLEDICTTLMGLTTDEFVFPTISYSVPHSNVQFADETPWNMLENVFLAASMRPFVDVLNRVRAHSTVITEASTLTLDNDRVVRFTGSKEVSSVSHIRLRWLDHKLSKSYEQDQLLYNTAMTGGFFDLSQEEDAWFSHDRRQRAEDTYMRIIEDINASPLGLDVARQKYRQIDLFHGEIELESLMWVPTLAGAALAAITANALIGDTVTTAPGTTVPWGRVLEAAATVSLLIVMMSIGVGRYEIWGKPFDFVHAKNTTLAYADNLPRWAENEVELDNDLVVSEEHAQKIAVDQLVWRAAGSYSFSVDLVDDPRIEVGDILQFADGTRLLVQSFSNDLTYGSKAIIKVSGYRV